MYRGLHCLLRTQVSTMFMSAYYPVLCLGWWGLASCLFNMCYRIIVETVTCCTLQAHLCWMMLVVLILVVVALSPAVSCIARCDSYFFATALTALILDQVLSVSIQLIVCLFYVSMQFKLVSAKQSLEVCWRSASSGNCAEMCGRSASTCTCAEMHMLQQCV